MKANAPVEAPLVAQDLREEAFVAARGHSIHAVVAAHLNTRTRENIITNDEKNTRKRNNNNNNI